MTSVYPPLLSQPISPTCKALQFDIVVIGGGIAGLAFTLRLPKHLSVALVTKGALGESNTRYAQGGLAAAIGPQDDPDLHFQDTLASGAGLCDAEAVRTLVDGGPDAVAWLLAQGTRFDQENDRIALGLEAAHSRNRVLHAGGDATGAEIERSLVQQIHDRPNLSLVEHAIAVDLVRSGGPESPVVGSTILLKGDTSPSFFSSRSTVLANGGAGQVWAVSSNPAGATGDGIAMALRAGVDVADLEFTQFHPTVFCAPGAEPFLMTEAIRGEGGWLRSADGTRFMPDLHPLAELAPRDVVARAVQSQMQKDHKPFVWLDLRHLDPARVRHRFPTIATHLAEHGLDLASDLIPVAPAAHYFIGGIVAGTDGTTSAQGLLAIGEVSCTGAHGANRLASNSLLEGLVFGLKAADRIASDGSGELVTTQFAESPPLASPPSEQIGSMKHDIQSIMSELVAVVRSAESLASAKKRLTSMAWVALGTTSHEEIELRNLMLLALEIVDSADFRQESRGAHFRSDFHDPDDDLTGLHQIVRRGTTATGRTFSPLLPSISGPIGS